MKTVLRVHGCEERVVPAVAIDSAAETYQWVLINAMRQNPAAFADGLQGLVNGTVTSALGYLKTDPVVADLRRMINPASPPANYTAALALMRGTPGAGPLAWDDLLENRAGVHSDWMKVNGFAHTGSAGPRTAIPGLAANASTPTDTYGYGPPEYPAWGENIAWSGGYLSSTKAGMSAYGFAGLEQRAAFLDAVGYMVELNSSSLGHLQNLLGRDKGAGGGLPAFNVIGLDQDLYQSPYEAQDGVAESWVSTERFGLRRPGGSGGYVAGVVYQDKNGNGAYDSGEGVAATVDVRNGGAGFTDTTPANGAFSGFVPNGTYSVTATVGGVAVGTVSAFVADGNGWAEIRVGGTTQTTNPPPAPPPPTVSQPAALTAPVLSAPTGFQNSLRPTVRWDAVSGAAGYRVWVDNLTTKVTNLFPAATASGNAWDPPADLVSGQQYRVWVRAVNGPELGPWSPGRDFAVAVPTRSGPSGTVAAVRPGFSWSAVGGAQYQVWVDDLTTGKTNVFPNTLVPGNAWAPPADLVPGRTYKWWVRALNGAGLGLWGPAGTFTVGTPALSGPTGTVADRTPTFTWSPVAGAATYQVWLDDLTTGRTLANLRTPAQTWTPPADLPAGRSYRFWVRAVNDSGLGAWVSRDLNVI